MYLPNYDPAYFWGPPLYYPYANWFYPPRMEGGLLGFGMGASPTAMPHGIIFLGGGWGGWGGWGWGFGWGGHSLMIKQQLHSPVQFQLPRYRQPEWNQRMSHGCLASPGCAGISNAAVSSRYGGNVRQNLQSRASASQAHTSARRPHAEDRRIRRLPIQSRAKWAIGKFPGAHPTKP